MADGVPIEAMNVIVRAVEKRFTGTNDKGDWSLQKVKIYDSTGEGKLLFSGCGDIPMSYIGQTIYIHSVPSNGERGGICGLVAATDKKDNIKIIKASAKAVVEFGAALSSQPAPTPPPVNPAMPQPPAMPTPPAFAPVPTPPATSMPTPPNVGPATNGDDLRHYLSRIVNLRLAITRAVHNYEQPEFLKITGRPMNGDEFQAAVSSHYIQCVREGWDKKVPAGRVSASE
jgi:hypothetical protein